MNRALRFLALICAIGSWAAAAAAQTFTIATEPRTQPQSTSSTTYTITITPSGGFNASVFLSATLPTASGATATVTPAIVNAPYAGMISVVVSGVQTVGTHQVVILAKNGPLMVRDTVTLVVGQKPLWQVLTTDNSGLPDNNVGVLGFQKNGTAWLTSGGLTSFDGITWTRYAPETLMPGADLSPYSFWVKYVSAFCIDSSDNVWLGLPAGIARFKEGEWIFYQDSLLAGMRFNDQGTTSYTGLNVRSIAADNQGRIWAVVAYDRPGDDDYALLKFDGTTWTRIAVTPAAGIPVMGPNRVAIDGTGAVWITSEWGVGLGRFDGTFWTLFTDAPFTSPSMVANVVTDAAGNCIALGSDAAYRFENNGFQRILSGGSDLRRLVFDRYGDAWLTGTQGLTRYPSIDAARAETFTKTNSMLPSDNVNSVAVATGRTIWIGTDKGLVLYDASTGAANPSRVRERPVAGAALSIQPNVVSESAVIRASLPAASDLRITIVDLLGHEVRKVHAGYQPEGELAIPIQTGDIAPGSYVVHLTSDRQIWSGRITIIR